MVVVALEALARFVPGPATEALTVSPTMTPAVDLYAYDGVLRTVLAVVLLGPALAGRREAASSRRCALGRNSCASP